MRTRILVAALALATISMTGFAQAAAPAAAPAAPAGDPVRVRGAIDSLAGDKLTITRSDNTKVTLTVPANAAVTGTTPLNVDEVVKPGAFLATTTLPKDGKLYAIDVRVFPAGAVAPRQFDYDLGEKSLMTNATVAEVTKVPEGRLVKVTWPDGKGEYIIPSDLKVYGTDAADKSLLVKGAWVVINGRKLPDGTLTANNISAERNGLKPGN